MSLESIIGFAAAMLILAMSPGPGVFATVSQSLSSGFRSSVEVIAGIIVGDILFLLFAAFGLTAMAYVLGDFFYIIKLAGAAYLVFLGVKMWRAKPVPIQLNAVMAHRGRWRRFLAGLFITLGNPKVILFYAGFLPGFMDLTTLTTTDLLTIAAIVTLVLALVMGIYSYSAAYARRFFRTSAAAKSLNRGAGAIMIGAGVMIAVRRN